MGHKDTRMLDRVYGRLSPEQLRERLMLALNAVAACEKGERNAPPQTITKARTRTLDA